MCQCKNQCECSCSTTTNFDLEAALIKGAEVETRSGLPVKIAGFNEEANNSNFLLGWVKINNNHWLNGRWDKNGKMFNNRFTKYDLVMAKKETEIWCRTYTTTSKQGLYIVYGKDKKYPELHRTYPYGISCNVWVDDEPWKLIRKI